eukprot:CAMPEP_0114515512 /NCGR_PEP_ID=MMETSP0109-20121206/16781_1 /TAXON_ID=29199 /ORGANISM="Chlorarachnion reptans, Strain CCCM449" /LENGTH=66 /DNA_ID=CAMNT_0001695733 /DNA_START=66 /DNA_END=263 /DNA_ORIENTATION=+
MIEKRALNILLRKPLVTKQVGRAIIRNEMVRLSGVRGAADIKFAEGLASSLGRSQATFMPPQKNVW